MKYKHKHFKDRHHPIDFDARYHYFPQNICEGLNSVPFNDNISNLMENNESNVQYHNCDHEANVSSTRSNCQNKFRLRCQKLSSSKEISFSAHRRRICDKMLIVAILSLTLLHGKF